MKHTMLIAAALLFTTAATADRIYFKASDSKASAEGQAPDHLEGKVIAEGGDSITVRVEGGEISVDRSLVSRVEKDALTVKDIEAKEAAARERLGRAETARSAHMAKWAEASASRRAERRQALERQEIQVSVDFQGMIPARVFRFYEPIIGRIDMDRLGKAIETFLRAELRRVAERR